MEMCNLTCNKLSIRYTSVTRFEVKYDLPKKERYDRSYPIFFEHLDDGNAPKYFKANLYIFNKKFNTLKYKNKEPNFLTSMFVTCVRNL